MTKKDRPGRTVLIDSISIISELTLDDGLVYRAHCLTLRTIILVFTLIAGVGIYHVDVTL
jgi:hypothetical protein